MTDSQRDGKTVVVTGGAKRIGRALALALARQGVHVVVHYHGSASLAEDTAQAARALGVQAWTLQADLADPAAINALLPRAIDAAGPIDYLINNASIFPVDTLASASPELIQRCAVVNGYAPLELGRHFASQGRDGAIINLLDTRMGDYDRDHVSYHLSKRMLYDLHRMMADEFAPRIRVNAIAPGLILSPEGKDASYLESLAHTNPLHKTGTVEDITDAALFLLRSPFITGQVLYVDGGRHMRTSIYG